MRAGVAFGSNVGERLSNLRAARERLERSPNVAPPILASAVYETEPVDCEPGAGPFLNAVVEIGFAGQPAELLQVMREIERDLGRPAAHAKNTSRTIDLDLLYFGAEQITTTDLQVPHPRIADRRFVLEPLAAIRGALILPGHDQPVATLLARCHSQDGLVRFAYEW